MNFDLSIIKQCNKYNGQIIEIKNIFYALWAFENCASKFILTDETPGVENFSSIVVFAPKVGILIEPWERNWSLTIIFLFSKKTKKLVKKKISKKENIVK